MQPHTFSSKLLVLLPALFLMMAASRLAAADTLTLVWDANQESALTGYVVHSGTQPGTYSQHTDVGLTTTFVFPNAVPGQRYCFAVSAYVAGPLEGLKSTEVCGFSDTAPTLVNPGARSSGLSQTTTLQLQGSDPDGLPISYSATGLPAGLTLMASTGFITGTPTAAGTYAVTATVSDGVLTASQTFTWTITPGTAVDTTAPVVTITAPTTAATYATSTAITLSGTASDNLGVSQMSWANDRGGSGTASGTTGWSVAAIALLSGTNVISVTARDAAGNTATDVLTVTFNATPTLGSIANQSSAVGQAASLQLSGSDADGNVLTYGANGLPPGLALMVSTGLISGMPTNAGTYAVTATVFDGTQSASRTFTWAVAAGSLGCWLNSGEYAKLDVVRITEKNGTIDSWLRTYAQGWKILSRSKSRGMTTVSIQCI
jgi:hypothetical protein